MIRTVLRKAILISISLLSLPIAISCSKDEDIDAEKPEIVSSQDSSPLNCGVFQRGENLPVNYTFTDNVALGSYNIEIHNNFDHHTHSTESGSCTLDPVKDPVNAWVYNRDFTIPGNPNTYNALMEIPIPSDIDCGDYHFMIRVTDIAGWQQIKSVSIKITD